MQQSPLIRTAQRIVWSAFKHSILRGYGCQTETRLLYEIVPLESWAR